MKLTVVEDSDENERNNMRIADSLLFVMEREYGAKIAGCLLINMLAWNKAQAMKETCEDECMDELNVILEQFKKAVIGNIRIMKSEESL